VAPKEAAATTHSPAAQEEIDQQSPPPTPSLVGSQNLISQTLSDTPVWTGATETYWTQPRAPDFHCKILSGKHPLASLPNPPVAGGRQLWLCTSCHGFGLAPLGRPPRIPNVACQGATDTEPRRTLGVQWGGGNGGAL